MDNVSSRIFCLPSCKIPTLSRSNRERFSIRQCKGQALTLEVTSTLLKNQTNAGGWKTGTALCSGSDGV